VVVDVAVLVVVEKVEKLVVLWVFLVMTKEEVGGDGGLLVEREMVLGLVVVAVAAA